VEEGQTNLELKPTEMAPVITGISNEFAALAKQKNIEFTSNIDTAASVKLNNPYFHSALWNILDNAYKFTHEGGIIELNAVDIDNKLEVIVKDNGIGIAANEITQLFTKFHRATDTLVYDYEGMGIGLYLTKLIVEQHNGTVEVESTEGKGSTFTFYLPIVNKSEN
jgi:signal transduction histidine kinase